MATEKKQKMDSIEGLEPATKYPRSMFMAERRKIHVHVLALAPALDRSLFARRNHPLRGMRRIGRARARDCGNRNQVANERNLG